MMCRLYGVTRAGYYAWRERGCSNREKSNALLAEQIRRAHQSSRGTYGSPRIYRALRSQGCPASENRIARLMQKHGIKARVATIRYTSPGMQRYYALIPNVQLDVSLAHPDQVWPVGIGFLGRLVIDQRHQMGQRYGELSWANPPTPAYPSRTTLRAPSPVPRPCRRR